MKSLIINKNLFILSLKNLRFNKSKVLIVFMGLASINILLYFLISLGFGIKENIIDKYLETIPVNEVVATKKSYVINLPLISNLSLSSKNEIDDKILNEISNLEGADKTYPVQNLNFPVSILIELFGYKFKSDLAVAGISESLLKSDSIELTKPFKFDFDKDKNIPALVSYGIIDLYNSNFAEANNLPKLSYKSVVGRHFTLNFGESSFGPTGKIKSLRCEIVGLSKRAELLGLTIPIETVNHLNKWFNEKYVPVYSTLYVKTKKVGDITKVSEKIRNLGFNAYSLKEVVEKINAVSASVIMIAFVLIGSIIIAVIFNIFNYYLTLIKSQEQDIRILKLIGFSTNNIKKIYLFQSFFITVLSSALSVAAARFMIYNLNIFLSKKVQEFARLNLNIFSIPASTDICIFAGSIIITLITVNFAVKTAVKNR